MFIMQYFHQRKKTPKRKYSINVIIILISFYYIPIRVQLRSPVENRHVSSFYDFRKKQVEGKIVFVGSAARNCNYFKRYLN